ncbi:MAG: DEAD/DEAH box helicase [Candidatus Heimdallarchaeota archaeon]|nr:DEAD/DEAH box helicase [Candidatus Heimdallarchaeota archaeon]
MLRLNDLFPYNSYRKAQLAIISAIQSTEKRTLLIDAETGTGKTVAVLSGVLSGHQDSERIIIFTKMLGQMDVWYRELGQINDNRRKLNYRPLSMIPLVGRHHLCPLVSKVTKQQFSQIGCSLFNCKATRVFYKQKQRFENLEALTAHLIAEITSYIQTGISLSEILWLINHNLSDYGCPYLVLQAALKQADIIITTYPFLIRTFLRELLMDRSTVLLPKTTMIIDEAHNLAKGNIANLTFRIVDKAIEEVGTHQLLQALVNLRDSKKVLHSFNPDSDLLEDLKMKGEKYLKARFKLGNTETSATLQVVQFLADADIAYLSIDRRYALYLKDPRKLLEPVKGSKQLILLSGTFRPLTQFAHFLGVPEGKKIPVISEVLRKNRIILTTSDPELSMKYKERTKERYLYFGKTIKQLTPHIPGHILVFTPNYEIATIFANLLETNYLEHPNQEIIKLINAVEGSNEKAIVVAPARGKISEGIEFVRDEKSVISSVIVAGLPYPPPSPSFLEIIERYSKFWGREQAINYMSYLQAAIAIRQCLGRMIRSENDRGAWIILDNRITNMDIFPRVIKCKDTETIIQRLQHFFTEE